MLGEPHAAWELAVPAWSGLPSSFVFLSDSPSSYARGVIFTSNSGNGHLIKLPSDSRHRLADSYQSAFEAFIGVIRECLDNGPASESEASTYVTAANARPLSVSATPGASTLEHILFAIRAGLDHARMVSLALRDDQSAFGVVTLTRGCVESLGKGWWLLNAETGVSRTARWLALLERETSTRERVNADQVFASIETGESLSLGDYRSQIAADRQSLATEVERAPTDTALAAALGDVIGPNGRERYSLLSAVAHGESLGIGDFVGITTGTRRAHYVVGMPAWLAEYCAETCFIAVSHVMRQLMEFVDHSDETGAVSTAHNEALHVMKSERMINAPVVERSFQRFAR